MKKVLLRVVFAFVGVTMTSSTAAALGQWPELSRNYRTPSDAATQIQALALALDRQQDRRALFAHIYTLTIQSAVHGLANGEFVDAAWVSRLIVNYANIYRRTLAAELAGHRDQLPKGWQLEFHYIDSTVTWTPGADTKTLWSPDLDLIYGINVHITRDLVEALLRTPTNFNSPIEHQDFLHITDSLRAQMPAIWSVFLSYEPDVHLPGAIEQPVMMEWIARLRAQSWVEASQYSAMSRRGQATALEALDNQVIRGDSEGLFLAL